MTPTQTAPDPALFPPEALAFAAERGVSEYLGPLYELAKQCFDGSDVTVKFETDYEAPGLSWIVYEVAVAGWEMDRYRTAYDRWLTAFAELCPSDLSIAFVLGMR